MKDAVPRIGHGEPFRMARMKTAWEDRSKDVFTARRARRHALQCRRAFSRACDAANRGSTVLVKHRAYNSDRPTSWAGGTNGISRRC